MVPARELAELDLAAVVCLAADLVSGGIVALANDGAAVVVIGAALVGLDHDVAAVLQRSDVALELILVAVAGVDLRLGFHEVGGGGHGFFSDVFLEW